MTFGHFWNVSMEDASEQEPTWNRSVNIFDDCHYKTPHRKSSKSKLPMVPTHALPVWLFLSKAIFNEALEFITRNSRVYIGSIVSGSDVNKHEAEATALHNGACKIGSYEYVTSPNDDSQMHDYNDWYSIRGLPVILAPCIPRRLVAEFPAHTTSLISPLEPWIDEEITLCRSIFWAYSNINNIKEWKLIVNCAAPLLNGEVEVDLLRLGLLLQGARHKLDRLEIRFVLGQDENPGEEDLLRVESALWKELQDLNERGIWDLRVDSKMVSRKQGCISRTSLVVGILRGLG